MSQIDYLNEKSNHSTSFRQCHHSDLSKVQKLVLQLYETDPGEYPVRPEIEKTFSEFDLHPEKGKIIVFERDGEIVGYAILVFFWSNEFGGDIIEIDEILIERKYRRLGIGKKFFSWLDNEYSECCGYALQTTAHNVSAMALYRSIGFRASRNKYFIRLKSAPILVSLLLAIMSCLASLSSIQEVMAKPLRQSVIISGEKAARPSYGESISHSTIIVLGDYVNTGKIKVSEVLSGDPSWTNKTLTLRSPLVMGCRLQPVPSFNNGAFIYRPPQPKGGRWGLTNEEYWEAFDLPDQISFVKFLVPIYKKQSEQQRLQALSELFIDQNIPKAGEFNGDPHSTFKKEFLWAITKMRKPENFEIVQKLYGRKDLSSTDKLSLQDWIGNTLDPRANSLLIEALNSKDRFVVSDAVTKLTSYYRNDKTDAALVLFLKTAPDELQPSIANYLKSRDVKSVKLSKAPAPQSLYQQAEELRQQGKLKEAVAIYIAILQSKETNSYVIRDAALKALRNDDAGTKTNILNSRLAWLAKDAASGNYLEVTDTAEILRRLNSPKCIHALLQVLRRRDSLFQNAHRTATFALRELGPEVQKRAAASILDDIKNNTDLSNNLDQQIETLLSFAWIKSKDSFQESQKIVEADKNWTSSWNKVIPLMESLSHEDEGLELSKLLREGKDLSPKIIEWIVFRLGDLRESRDVETLLLLYSDKPYYYQPTLKEALVKIGGAKIITYMRESAITKHPQQATAVEILAEIEKKKVLPVMHQVAHSGNLDARVRSIAAIGQYGNCDDRKALLPGADYWKGDRNVHYWLIQALNAIELRCHCQ